MVQECACHDLRREQHKELLAELRAQGIVVPVVLSDLFMPGMNGDELLVRVRQIDPSIRTVLLTGLTCAWLPTSPVWVHDCGLGSGLMAAVVLPGTSVLFAVLTLLAFGINARCRVTHSPGPPTRRRDTYSGRAICRFTDTP
jgi:hypothetical protein